MNQQLPAIVYFVGIGGIGMSAIARYYNSKGVIVAGYDKNPTPLTQTLIKEGISIHFDENTEVVRRLFGNTPQDDILCIFTPAVPADHVELSWLQENNFRLIKRSLALAEIVNEYRCVAVAGTHGKTTTSSMIAHILTESGMGCQAFLGGIASNYNSNLILHPTSDIAVVEADEFDRSFLALSPDIATVTSVDADHLDIYGDANQMHEAFSEFAQKVNSEGKLFTQFDIPAFRHPHETQYSVEGDSKVKADNISVKDGTYHFDYQSDTTSIANCALGLPGRHNVENVTAAIAVCLQLGVEPDAIKKAVASYRGVKRRFEVQVKKEDCVYIDDYAHHPTELRATIRSAREMYPNKKITGIFQPHLFSRTQDFADEFAESLALLDQVILLPIYAARELPIPGVNSQMLLDKISGTPKKLMDKSDLLTQLKNSAPEVLLTLGAGDIDQLVEPIRSMLE